MKLFSKGKKKKDELPEPPKPTPVIKAGTSREGKEYNIVLTHEELEKRIAALQSSKYVRLLYDLERGKEEYEELQQLMEMLSNEN